MSGTRRLLRRVLLLVAASAAVAAAVHFWRPKVAEEDTLRVPLGVEQAAIVTYSGPAIAVAPYKWGVAVNVRMAEVIERDGKRIYDVRYIVNRGGTFDLKDYLTAEDGSALDGLPTFQFTGDPKLSKNLDTRIQETEDIRVDVGGRYYETLAGLIVLWLVWLLLLIFWKRPQPPKEPEGPPPGPTLAEMLRDLLARLEAGTLDAEGKAKLEMVLLRCWRNDLVPRDATMIESVEAISRHEKTGALFRKLQHWLHHPASAVPREEIAAIIVPHAAPALP
jgi:hypothetical protein